jgi:hypothetical protein
MRKLATSALAAITAAGAVLAAQPAQADRWRHHRDNDNDEVAAAIVGGIAGLAIGAALAGRGDRDHPYTDGYSSRPYSRRERYDDDRTCISRDRVYDPYIGRRVTIERRYRC